MSYSKPTEIDKELQEAEKLRLEKLINALNQIAKQFQPSSRENATYFWTTLQFIESIEQITGINFSENDIIPILELEGYINEFTLGIGLVWWVMETSIITS